MPTHPELTGRRMKTAVGLLFLETHLMRQDYEIGHSNVVSEIPEPLKRIMDENSAELEAWLNARPGARAFDEGKGA
jgi:hypothetical protein